MFRMTRWKLKQPNSNCCFIVCSHKSRVVVEHKPQLFTVQTTIRYRLYLVYVWGWGYGRCRQKFILENNSHLIVFATLSSWGLVFNFIACQSSSIANRRFAYINCFRTQGSVTQSVSDMAWLVGWVDGWMDSTMGILKQSRNEAEGNSQVGLLNNPTIAQ